jgi:aspartyl-tRNA(Asn)/glutamyl-tRNA(Gln) amidotransferase subunit C
MAITREEVEHVAHLSRLELSPHELNHFAAQLGSILHYVAKLDELDTSEVEPMLHGLDGREPARADLSASSLTRDEALANAPDRAGGCFKVPRIIE